MGGHRAGAGAAAGLLLVLLLAAGAPRGAQGCQGFGQTPAASAAPGLGCCPNACLCASEPVQLDEEVPAAAGLRAGPANLMACFGLPSAEELAEDTEILRVSNATIRRLDFWALRRAHRLLVLDMAGNGIAEVSGSGKTAPKLRVLDLSGNSLHVLQTFAFKDFPDLRVLNLSVNGLHSLAPSAFALASLAVLDLRGNKLTVLKAHFFSDAPALRELYLSDNALSRVPSFVFPGALDVLDLSGNHIIRVEEGAFDGVNVSRVLDLSRNALRRVPNAALKRLGAVRVLELSDNPLGPLPAGAVAGLAVQVLSLRHIRALSIVHRDAFVNLPELRELRLSANAELTYVHPGSLVNVPRLRSLDLSGSPLYTLERALLDAAPSLASLRLDNNTLHCHCSLGWLRNLTERPVTCRDPDSDTSSSTSSSPSPSSRPSTSAPAEPTVIPSVRPQVGRTESPGAAVSAGVGVTSGPGRGGGGGGGGGGTPIVDKGDCPPYIVPLFPLEFSETLGNNASFHCRALGGTDLKVSWYSKDGTELANDQCSERAPRVCVRDLALTVLYLHAEDAGTYSCVARNAAAAGGGSDSRTVTLHVRDVHVRLLPLTVTSTFVTLAWNMSSSVTNSYTLRVEEVDGDPGAAPESVKSVTFTVGLKMHSYTVHGLKPRSQYAFTLAIQREAYSLVIGSAVVTTREGAFLVSLGIERSYLSIILVSVLGGAFTAACLGFCGLRCWRQRLRLRQAAQQAALRKSDSAFSGREMLSSTSCSYSLSDTLTVTNSPDPDPDPVHRGSRGPGRGLFSGITYISLADDRVISEPEHTIEQDLISFT